MEEIIVYPFAIDPRLVNKAFNGVKLPYNKIEQIYHIRDDHYLIVTIDSLEYVVLTINPATLICTTI